MKLAQILRCEKKLAELEIKGITNDSRQVKEGYLFVNTSGNPLYDSDALNKGGIVVTSNKSLKNVIYVDDTAKAFAEACANWYSNPAKKLKLLGVTGTNGKTSITYMLKAILEAAGKKVGLIGTNKNLIAEREIPSINTTPNAYYLNGLLSEMVEAECEYVIMEVSSHALAQGHVEGFKFAVSMFTNLTQDHLDFHGSMDEYFAAKSKLFEISDIAVINADDQYGRMLLNTVKCKKVTYSTENNADFIAKGINCQPSRTSFKLLCDELLHIDVNTGGNFTVYNALCAISAAKQLGIENSAIVTALANFCGVKGRAEVVKTNKDFTVIIDYAHTPDGLKNILKTFKKCAKNRIILVFGCGGDRDKTKRAPMGEIASIYADYVIVTSDNPRTENPREIINDIMNGIPNALFKGKIIENRAEAIKFALSIAQKDDIIILAGKGHETYQIIGKEKIHFDEREIVFSALQDLD
jgi:UDP-N-acetylmuramoyl-L-alanyl-D-glutamate--2,6-diaminopimelate ligase